MIFGYRYWPDSWPSEFSIFLFCWLAWASYIDFTLAAYLIRSGAPRWGRRLIAIDALLWVLLFLRIWREVGGV